MREVPTSRFVTLIVAGLILVTALAVLSFAGKRNEEGPSGSSSGARPVADFNFETGEGLVGSCDAISRQIEEKELFSARVMGDTDGLTEFGNDSFRFFFPSGWTVIADHDATALKWWIGPGEEAGRVLFAVIPHEPGDAITRSTRWLRPVIRGQVHSQTKAQIGDNAATILEVRTDETDPGATRAVVLIRDDRYGYAFADYEARGGPREDELRNGFERMYSTFSLAAARDRERDRYFVKAVIGGKEKLFRGSLAKPAGGRLTHVSHRSGGYVHVSIRAYDEAESGDFMSLTINAPDLRPGTYDGSFGWYGHDFSYQSKCTFTLHEGGSLTGSLKGGASCARLKGYGKSPTASEPIEGLEFDVKMRGVGCAVGD